MIPKIHECLANDSLRPVMNYAFVTKEETAASDAHILVVHSTAELFGEDFVKTIPEEGLYFDRELLIDLAKTSAIEIRYKDNSVQIQVTHSVRGKELFNRYFDLPSIESVGQ